MDFFATYHFTVYPLPSRQDTFCLVVTFNLGLLLCLSLLICRFPLLLLLSLPGASGKRAGSCANGRPLTGITGYRSDSRPDQCATGCSAKRAATLGRLLLRDLLSSRGVIAGLLNRPLVALEFILLLLFGTLAFCRIDQHLGHIFA